MPEKGTKLKIAQRVFGTDFTYDEYEGKTETVSIPFGDLPTYMDTFTEDELAQLLNRIVRIDFVNYSNRKPSQKVDAVKVFLGKMVDMNDTERLAYLDEHTAGSRVQAPAPEEE